MKKILAAAALGLTALSTCADARAPVAPLWTGVGQWIAAQGNAALRDMREEFRTSLQGRLQMLVPERPQQPAERVARNPDPAV